jgi:hypothetical protein
VLRCRLWQQAKVLIGVGPNADWRAKLLICRVMEAQSWMLISGQKPTSGRTFLQSRDTYACKLAWMRSRGG